MPVTITAPVDFEMFQRDSQTNAQGIAGIPIAGTYTGSPTAIEADLDGQGFVVIDPAPTGGAFSGVLTASVGQGILTVRFANDTGDLDTVATVGVGDVFLVAGQSNASGRATNNQTYSGAFTATMLSNAYNWQELVDPFDDPTGTPPEDSVGEDNPSLVKGSWIPRLATTLMATSAAPAAFITAAKGGTSITEWLPGGDRLDRSTLYGLSNYRAQFTAGIRAVLWWQGETDANDSMPQATYQTHYDNVATAYGEDLAAPIMGARLHDINNYDDNDLDAIRFAIDAVVASNPNAVAGPDLEPIAGSLHPATDALMDQIGDLWAAAVISEFTRQNNPKRLASSKSSAILATV